MPAILPHQLIPFLLQQKVMLDEPEMDHEIEYYWRFLSSVGFPMAADKPGSGTIPLWIWGDDSQYNEQGSKVVLVSIGAVLDWRTCSKMTTWPLFAYKVESQLMIITKSVAHRKNFIDILGFLGWLTNRFQLGPG